MKQFSTRHFEAFNLKFFKYRVPVSCDVWWRHRLIPQTVGSWRPRVHRVLQRMYSIARYSHDGISAYIPLPNKWAFILNKGLICKKRQIDKSGGKSALIKLIRMNMTQNLLSLQLNLVSSCENRLKINTHQDSF